MLFYRRAGAVGVSHADLAASVRGDGAVSGLASDLAHALPWSAPEPELPTDSEDEGEEENDESSDGESEMEAESDEDQDWEPPPRARRSAFTAAARSLAATANPAASDPTSFAMAGRRRSFAVAAASMTRCAASAADATSAAAATSRPTATAVGATRSGLSLLPHALAGRIWWRRSNWARGRQRGSQVGGAIPRGAAQGVPAHPALAPGRLPPLRRKKAAAKASLATGSATAEPAIGSLANAAPSVTQRAPRTSGALSSRPFGAMVGTWDDAAVPASTMAVGASAGKQTGVRKRAYDYWDAELDRGHVRKTQAVRDENRRLKLEKASGWLRSGGGKGSKGSGGKGGSGKGRGGGKGKGKGKGKGDKAGYGGKVKRQRH